MNYIKKPTPPQGAGAQEAWLRGFLNWVSQFECVSVVGGLKKPNPTGNGYSLVIDSQKASGAAHPFQIYQTSTWLKYKVRTGGVITTGDPITATGIETEFDIASNVLRYWFYIELTSTTAVVNVSATTLVWSSTKIPIGWVDTQTYLASSIGEIKQFVTTNIFNPCV